MLIRFAIAFICIWNVGLSLMKFLPNNRAFPYEVIVIVFYLRAILPKCEQAESTHDSAATMLVGPN